MSLCEHSINASVIRTATVTLLTSVDGRKRVFLMIAAVGIDILVSFLSCLCD